MTAIAQQPQPSAASTPVRLFSRDVAATFDFERARTTGSSGTWFWLKGGSVNGSLTLYHGLGVAANLAGNNASNIQNGVGLSEIAFMAGPRYTVNVSRYTGSTFRKHSTMVFGEVLFGGVHAFHSVFPGAGGVTSSAGSFAMQLGGGLDIGLCRGFNVRPLEIDWVHTALPDNAGNVQNNFRVGFGFSYRR